MTVVVVTMVVIFADDGWAESIINPSTTPVAYDCWEDDS